MKNIRLLSRSIKHLKLMQLCYQVINRLVRMKYKTYVANIKQMPLLKFDGFIEKPTSYSDNTFTFINLSSVYSFWNDTSHGMLWAYNLNYMDWLLQPNMSFEQGEKWIELFIKDTESNKVGLDPYPIALRTINWIKFISIHRNELSDDQLQRWNNSLYSQIRLLEKKLEYHLLGNHLLENFYALFIVAIYFGCKKMYKRYSKLLLKELDEQILADGAHYEQSIMYHLILLDRLLDCYNISSKNLIFVGQEEVNRVLQRKAEIMLGHLKAVVYRDGSFPLFNDAVYDVAPTANEVFTYTERLGITFSTLQMKECGYRGFANDLFEARVDVGNLTATYQPGHTHADTFSYELRIDGKPFIVDTGISTYNKNARRNYERSTAAHNTVVLEGRNSSETWGGFRVGKRAKVTHLNESSNSICASHDGFGALGIHTRTFRMYDESFEIQDRISTAVEAMSYIHLDANVKVLSIDNSKIVTDKAMIYIESANDVRIIDAEISNEYNVFKQIKKVCLRFVGEMSYKIILNENIIPNR